MATMQEIEGRIASVRVTRQIAQAMKLVSNAKIARCRALWEHSRPFFDENQALLRMVTEACDGRSRACEIKPGPTLYIVLGSDRGLCGGYNMNVCRLAHKLSAADSQGALVFTLGVRVRDYFARRSIEVAHSFRGVSENPFYADSLEVAARALELYHSGQVTKIVLVYTRYASALSHIPTAMTLLPVTPGEAVGSSVTLEPTADEMVDALLPDYLAGCIFGALTEGSLCEQSARMTSMDAAVRNCGDLIGRLQLQYNQARQDAITLELNEIVGGAEALAGSDRRKEV